jgi:uncharacterized protein
MKILALSDQRLTEMEQQQHLRQAYADVDCIISCGDLDASYLEFITTVLNRPLYYVRGNHDTQYAQDPPGGQDLHMKFQTYKGVSMIGLEGSMFYNGRDVQYTERQMFWKALAILPRLLWRRWWYGYGVDYLVTHSPPKGIHDREDIPHRGYACFLWLMRWARPRYLIHGHIDVWDRREKRETDYFSTRVINIDPKRVLDSDVDKQYPPNKHH